MKNLLKFISIGLVMVMVLYSQMTPDATVEAAADTVDNNKVEFMTIGDNSTSFETKKVTHYGAATANSAVNFFINDVDLNKKHTATTTYTGADGGTAAADALNWNLASTANNPAAAITAASTPATGSIAFTAAAADVRNNTIVVTRNNVIMALDTYSLANGTFSLQANTTVGDGDPNPIVSATFDYDAQDCYGGVAGAKAIAAANPNNDIAGCGAGTTNVKRVQVTSTSDSTGEWATIVEVKAYGDDDPTNAADIALTGGIFRGSVNISTDASHSSTADGSVWVQDGDTLTVSYYEKLDSDGNVGALISSDTVTIDATAPTITNVSPADGFLTNDKSPAIEFTIEDSGSGFDKTVTNFGDHVDVEINGCNVVDTELGVKTHSESSITVTYSPAIDWTSGAKNNVNAGEAANCTTTNAATTRVSGGFNVDSDYSANLNNTNEMGSATVDGIQFSWKIVATDEAGNAKTLGSGVKEGAKAAAGAGGGYANAYKDTDLNIRIDTQVPAATGVTAAKAWDSGAKADKTDKASVKVLFDESLDASSVAASDFTVSGTGVTSSVIEEVTMGGTGVGTDTAVYFKLAADLGPNAKPKVKLVGEITDRAGNILKPDTGKTSKDLGTASDGVDPTISNGAVSVQLLDTNDETKITFESNENLTNTGTNPNADSAGGSAGANPANTHVGCTCGSMSGGNALKVVAASGGGATAINGTDTQKIAVTLSSPKAGSGTIKQADISPAQDGIYGIALTGRDAADNNGVAGITKVANEDVSKYFVASGTNHMDGTTDGAFGQDDDIVEFKLKNWPLADHDGDGELSDSIVGVTVNGTPWTAAQLALHAVHKIDWSEKESVWYQAITYAAATAIGVTDTVKVTYWYVDAAQTIEVDTSAPSASFTPADGESTTDTTPSIQISWDDDEYAGDTHTTVTIMKAELKDSDAVVTDISGELSTTDNKNFYYKPTVALATGEYTVTVKAKDEIGNESADFSAKITIKDRTKTEITMAPGWNLISVPGEPADSDINAVITNPQVDTVLTYDPSIPGGWLTAVRDGDTLVGTLTTIDASHAYWVHSNNSDKIKVDIPGYLGGATSVPPAIAVVKGWNLVPAVTLTGATTWDADVYFYGLNWAKAKSWDAAGESWSDILPDLETDADRLTTNATVASGKGYWLYANEAGTIVP